MTQRASESLVAALIRIGLLLALAIMLMAGNAWAQSLPVRPGRTQPGLAVPQACGRQSLLPALEPTGRSSSQPGSTSKETE